MSSPSLISFVGVDKKTNIEDLCKIQDLNSRSYLANDPIIEWGVLVSPQRAGKQNRYPTLDFAKDFIFENDTIAKSIHLCGGAVDEYLFRPNSDIGFLASYSKARIQLNFSMDKYDPEKLTEIILHKLLEEKHEIIVQYNKSKKKFVDNLVNKIMELGVYPDLSILYDGSGGFGRTIENFDPPVGEFFTGYAGGLKPENIKDIVTNINAVSKGKEYYIDMESGIRTDDFLDLEKCKSVIATVKEFADSEVME